MYEHGSATPTLAETRGRGLGIITSILWNVDVPADIEGPYQSAGIGESKLTRSAKRKLRKAVPNRSKNLITQLYLTSANIGLFTNLIKIGEENESYYEGKFTFGVYGSREWFGRYDKRLASYAPRSGFNRGPGLEHQTAIGYTWSSSTIYRNVVDLCNNNLRVSSSEAQSVEYIRQTEESIAEYVLNQ
jgi:hypothetical protein